MPFVNTKKMLDAALKQRYALGAFNFSTLGLFRAITAAAVSQRSPLIISTSEGEAGHVGMDNAFALVSSFASKSKIPIALHLDHGGSLEAVEAALRAGYPSVHIDASKLPIDENIRLTKRAAALAHRKGATIEGELGHIGGASKMHAEGMEAEVATYEFTDPEEAKRFAAETGIDSIAVSIGSLHGIWKTAPKLDFARLERIRALAKIPVVLHGGSGIPDEQVRKAVSLGIAKVNVNTEMRIAFTNALRRSLLADVETTTPYKYLRDSIPAVQKVVEGKMRVFGCAGRA